MITFLYSVIGFITAIGVLVTIHEFGHYWVAKKMGVKVLKFSVGFGKPLWSKTSGPDQTEYCIGSIPLGGYVKMLDEREGDVDPNELDRAFTQKTVYQRFAVVAAGPIFNFIFAIVAYSLLFMTGISGVKPMLGAIETQSIAARAGLETGQQILEVNQKPVISWSSARFQMLDQSVGEDSLNLTVIDSKQVRSVKRLDLSQVNFLQDQTDFLELIGITAWRPIIAPIIDEVISGGAAEKAGFQAGDEIQSIDGVEVKDIGEWVKQIQNHPGQQINVVVSRNGSEVSLTPIPDIHERKGNTIGLLGVKNKIVFDPEEQAKLQVTERYPIHIAIYEAVARTGQMSWLTLKVLGRLVVGEASVKNLSGPLTIAQYAGVTVRLGLEPFLTFMALISISLGVLNLLPIPVLDGGHLFYYLIEMIKGSPVSEAFEMNGQKLGLALLLCFMSIAIYNDILRLVG